MEIKEFSAAMDSCAEYSSNNLSLVDLTQRQYKPEMGNFKSDRDACDRCLVSALAQQGLISDTLSNHFAFDPDEISLTFHYPGTLKPAKKINAYYLGYEQLNQFDSNHAPGFVWATEQGDYQTLVKRNRSYLDQLRFSGTRSGLELFSADRLKLIPFPEATYVHSGVLIAAIASRVSSESIGFFFCESEDKAYYFVLVDDGSLPRLEQAFVREEEKLLFLHSQYPRLKYEAGGILKNELLSFLTLAEDVGLKVRHDDDFAYASYSDDSPYYVKAQFNYMGKIKGIDASLPQ